MTDERYRILFDHASDGHLIILEGSIVDCNQAAVDLIGCASREDVLRIHPAVLSPERQPDGRLSLEKAQEMDATARARGFHRFEWVHQTVDGEPLPVMVTINAIQIGGKQGLIAVWHDLREIKRQEQALRDANAKMKQDLEAAARVQASLLPSVLPDIDGVACAWAFSPADELAGDILNVFLLDPRHLCFYVLDVSGHGVASSLLSVTASHFLSPLTTPTLLRRFGASDAGPHGGPGEIAELLNQRFQSRGGTVQFFTLFCGILDLDTRELRYACAAHPGAVRLAPDGTTTLLEHPGLPIGVVSHAEYTEEAITLGRGDRVFVFSDGIPEARGPDGAFYGVDRLVARIRSARTVGLNEAVDELVGDARAWCAPHPPQDDISVLAIEIRS
jgi:sigma-B regulation protein RsbU (phosphoserine phosphatase)